MRRRKHIICLWLSPEEESTIRSFKDFVLSRHGKLYGHFTREILEALKEYMQNHSWEPEIQPVLDDPPRKGAKYKAMKIFWQKFLEEFGEAVSISLRIIKDRIPKYIKRYDKRTIESYVRHFFRLGFIYRDPRGLTEVVCLDWQRIYEYLEISPPKREEEAEKVKVNGRERGEAPG